MMKRASSLNPSFLESFIESISTLPGDLNKNFSLMRELDQNTQNILAEVSHKLDSYLASEQRSAEIEAQLREEQQKALDLSDEKVQLAIQTYDVVDRCIRRLDNDLREFEEYLKIERERKQQQQQQQQGKPGATVGRGGATGKDKAYEEASASESEEEEEEEEEAPKARPVIIGSGALVQVLKPPTIGKPAPKPTTIGKPARGPPIPSPAAAAATATTGTPRTPMATTTPAAMPVPSSPSLRPGGGTPYDMGITAAAAQGLLRERPAAAEAESQAPPSQKRRLSGPLPTSVPSSQLSLPPYSGASLSLPGATPMVGVDGDARVHSVEDMPVDPNEPVYCYCQRVSFGQMVACDNPDCEREWFHFACVGLTSAPKGKWFCPDCRKSRASGNQRQ